MLLFIINTAYHMWIGMQEIILDYVHEDKLKLVSLMANTFFVFAVALRVCYRHSQAFVRGLTSWRRTENQTAAAKAAPADQRPRLSDRGSQLRRRGDRRRRLRPARRGRLQRSGPAHRLHHQGVPDPLAHRRGARRHRRRARQYGRGRLALAHVRHRQGRRLARRPGRHRISLPQRAGTRSTSWSTGACRSRAARKTARSISARSAA